MATPAPSERGVARRGGRARLLMLAAQLHHIEGRTLAELGKLDDFKDLKPTTLWRIVDEARDLVDRDLKGPREQCLEAKLRSKFQLRDAIVVEAGLQRSIAPVLGSAAANYFQEHVESGSSVAVSCGQTLLQMMLRLPRMSKRTLRIVPLSIEGSSAKVEEAPSTFVGLLKAKCHRESTAFGAHLVVARDRDIDEAYRHSVSRTPAVQRASDIARQADWTFVGVGTARAYEVDGEKITPSFVDLMNEASNDEYPALAVKWGLLGEINNEPYDSSGRSAYGLDQRLEDLSRSFVIRLCDLDQIKTIAAAPGQHRVVGVAGGAAKVHAIEIALRTRMINVLITDRETAETLRDAPQPCVEAK